MLHQNERGITMNGVTILLVSLVFLILAYLLYGRWLAKKWGIDPKAKTPAYEFEDGVDYVPADRQVVFGHQFASIAGAGPINGPIQAAMFGWIPIMLWCLLGGVFIGAVHDFSAMYASVKNKGNSIGLIIEQYVGKTGKKLFLLFCWLFCILVVAAFADIVASTFNGFTTSPEGVISTVAINGSVASTSIMFIVFAIALGIFFKYTKLNPWINTVIAVGLLVLSIVIGLAFPIYQTLSFWHIAVFIYIFAASVLPVWLLLQPRDYLNSYLLIVMMVAAVVGIFVYNPEVNLIGFAGFTVNNQYLFPTLFVTIACGAISGFHSLVSSGTSSKQIKNEKDMLPVSFGSMLLEVLLSIISLITVAYLATGAMGTELPTGTPAQIFATAIATFLSKIGIDVNFSSTLITLAVSAFALTSLDSVARVGRLSFQELFMDADKNDGKTSGVTKVFTNKYVATTLTLVLGYMLAKVGYKEIWPLFGSANQLLAALSLVACSVFLKHTKRQGWMLWGPMVFMLAVTFTALVIVLSTTFGKVMVSGATIGLILQLVFGVLLFCLGLIVAGLGFKKLTAKE